MCVFTNEMKGSGAASKVMRQFILYYDKLYILYSNMI